MKCPLCVRHRAGNCGWSSGTGVRMGRRDGGERGKKGIHQVINQNITSIGTEDGRGGGCFDRVIRER